MNNTARFLSIAAVAAFASFGAQADEADASQFATKFDTNRTRAEVAAEAATVAQTRSIEPAGSRVVTYKSTAGPRCCAQPGCGCRAHRPDPFG